MLHQRVNLSVFLLSNLLLDSEWKVKSHTCTKHSKYPKEIQSSKVFRMRQSNWKESPNDHEHVEIHFLNTQNEQKKRHNDKRNKNNHKEAQTGRQTMKHNSKSHNMTLKMEQNDHKGM